MGFERHRKIEFRVYEAAHEEIGVAFEPEEFKLDMKQSTLGAPLR